MPINNVISAIPAFTTDDAPEVKPEVPEVKEPEVPEEEIPEVPGEEKETPDVPPPDIAQPAAASSEDIEKLNKVLAGLQHEATNLRKDISELRGQRRELKEQKLVQVKEQIDQLKDVHPEDVATIEKILHAKGYVTKEESSKMFYDSVKTDCLAKFLEKYPEYKPENDTGDARWSALQTELSYYRMPEDPHKISDLLEKAHRTVAPAKVPNERPNPIRRAAVAAVGAGGGQRPPSTTSDKKLDPHKRLILEQGGWSEEEIKKIEQNLK